MLDFSREVAVALRDDAEKRALEGQITLLLSKLETQKETVERLRSENQGLEDKMRMMKLENDKFLESNRVLKDKFLAAELKCSKLEQNCMDNDVVIESLTTANEQLEVRASFAETRLKEVEEGCSRFEAEVNEKCNGHVKMVEDRIYFNA